MLKNTKQKERFEDSKMALNLSYSPNDELPALDKELWLYILSFFIFSKLAKPSEIVNISLISKFFYTLTQEESQFLPFWHNNYLLYFLKNKDEILQKNKIYYQAYKKFCLGFLEEKDPKKYKHRIEVSSLFNFENSFIQKELIKLKLYENLDHVEKTIKQEYQEDLWPKFVCEFFKINPEQLAYDHKTYINEKKKRGIPLVKLDSYFADLYTSNNSMALDSALAKRAYSASFIYELEYENNIEKKNKIIINGTRALFMAGFLFSSIYLLVITIFYYIGIYDHGMDPYSIAFTFLGAISFLGLLCCPTIISPFLPLTSDFNFQTELTTQHEGDEEKGFELSVENKKDPEEIEYESDPEKATTKWDQDQSNLAYNLGQRLFSFPQGKSEKEPLLLLQGVNNMGYTHSKNHAA